MHAVVEGRLCHVKRFSWTRTYLYIYIYIYVHIVYLHLQYLIVLVYKNFVTNKYIFLSIINEKHISIYSEEWFSIIYCDHGKQKHGSKLKYRYITCMHELPLPAAHDACACKLHMAHATHRTRMRTKRHRGYTYTRARVHPATWPCVYIYIYMYI